MFQILYFTNDIKKRSLDKFNILKLAYTAKYAKIYYHMYKIMYKI